MKRSRATEAFDGRALDARAKLRVCTTKSTRRTPPIVALGGSAGSLNALIEFFALMPGDCGMAFVVVMHLSPHDESNLPELLQHHCAMRVSHSRDNQKIVPNHVYVTPPGQVCTYSGDRLKLASLNAKRGVRTVIDSTFGSLARAGAHRIAGIVLSGANSDGAASTKRIKEAGGLTLAQDPAEAAHGVMPRAAIAGGAIDGVLRVREMPARLFTHFGIVSAQESVRPHDGSDEAIAAVRLARALPNRPTTKEIAWLRAVLSFLRRQTGRDFSSYRESVLLRLLKRRMVLLCLRKPGDYVKRLKANRGEAEALVRELLIPYTSFFRDPDAFASLGRSLAALFERKGAEDFLRVWVPACATGEEAYSLAMLLAEYADTLDDPPSIQVFGCDLDAHAIEKARAGVYSTVTAEAVGADRLRRFFSRDHQSYRVGRQLRKMTLFAVHDVIRDSAFARMDVVSCRNLLIYLSAKGQKHMMDAFAFALRGGGLLFLGASEGLLGGDAGFEPVDPKNRLYRRVLAPSDGRPAGPGANATREALAAEERAYGPRQKSETRTTERAAVAPFQNGLELLRARLQKVAEQPFASGSRAANAANQELRVITQELHATMEELEINRQELRSMNGELSAVNAELTAKLNELERTNGDLTNLMNATAIATIFLDRKLRIMRFTPSAAELFPFTTADCGRPLSDLRHQLEYPLLLDDLKRVVASAQPLEKEVCDADGRWFLARVLPYRTPERATGGVVLTFLDITERKRTEERLRESEQGLARELADTKHLQALSSVFIEHENATTLYEEIVQAALTLMQSDAASLQMLDPSNDELRLLAWRGLHPRSAKHWERISAETGTTCGIALQLRRPFIVADVNDRPPSSGATLSNTSGSAA